MIIGYARVSATDQNLDAQTDALTAAGAERLFSERVSGVKAERPELDKMLDQLRDGDVVVVTKYERRARSLRDLLDIAEAVKERSAGFRSLIEDIYTTAPAGDLIFHVVPSVSHLERRRIAELSRESLAAVRKGDNIGRRHTMREISLCVNFRRHFGDHGHILPMKNRPCLDVTFTLLEYHRTTKQ